MLPGHRFVWWSKKCGNLVMVVGVLWVFWVQFTSCIGLLVYCAFKEGT
jgi:hypothetical protein